jgi:membrane protease YdiL (CAAX protease family)
MVEQSFSVSNGMLTVLTISLISPIGEELAFRGVALKLSQEACHNSAAPICITAILFGLYHGNPVQICYAIPAGIILALVAVKSSSIIPAIILHMATNVTSYLLPETISQLTFVAGALCLGICLVALCKLSST